MTVRIHLCRPAEGDRGRIKPNDSRLRYAITPHGSLGRLISNYFDDQDPS